MTSVKKKMGQIGVVTLLLVLLTAFMGVMASAEEGGYWTEQLDEEGPRRADFYVYRAGRHH